MAADALYLIVNGLKAKGCLNLIDIVKLLPCEKLYMLSESLAIDIDGNVSFLRLTAEVAIGGGWLVDGVLEFETLNDGVGTHIEHLFCLSSNLAVGERNMRSAIGVDVEANGLSDADGIGHLDENLVCHTRSHEILGNVASRIGRRAVDLRGILARESATAMGTLATIGVNNNLSACQTSVAVGATNDELARRVDKELELRVVGGIAARCVVKDDNLILEKGGNASRQKSLDARQEDVFDILANDVEHLLLGCEIIMLGRDDDGVNAQRLVVVRVLDGHLALGVRAEVGHDLALAANLAELLKESVSQIDGEGHKFLCVAAGVAEHHALVSSALLLLVCTNDTLVNVMALLVEGRDDATALRVELILALVISDGVDDAARNILHRDVAVSAKLAGAHRQSGCHESLARHLALLVLNEKGVENSVRNLIGHLVRMALGDGLRSEEI